MKLCSVFAILAGLSLVQAVSTHKRISRDKVPGFIIDHSCTSHVKPLQGALNALPRLVRQGWLEAHDKISNSYDRFFRPEDRPLLQLAFNNFLGIINGAGPTITLTCDEAPTCREPRGANMFIDRREYREGNMLIHVCEKTWSGPSGEVVPDYCADEHNQGLTVSVLHELAHFEPLVNGTIVWDVVYGPDQCEELRQGKYTTDDEKNPGKIRPLVPIENAQSYTFLAVDSLKVSMVTKGKCPRWRQGTDGIWHWVGDTDKEKERERLKEGAKKGALSDKNELRRLLALPNRTGG